MNVVCLAGNIGMDAETKYTKSGVPYARFSLATSKRVKRNESYEDETQWHRIMLWGAEGLHKFLTKGQKVAVQGELEHRSWEGRDGQTKYMTEVVVQSRGVTLMGSPQQARHKSREPEPQEPSWASGGDYHDDIPF